MKILDSIQEQPKPFQPVGVVFETKEELEFVTKLIGMTSNNDAGNILNNAARFYDTWSMYKMLEKSAKSTVSALEIVAALSMKVKNENH